MPNGKRVAAAWLLEVEGGSTDHSHHGGVSYVVIGEALPPYLRQRYLINYFIIVRELTMVSNILRGYSPHLYTPVT